MTQTFEQWRDGLDASIGDKIITDVGEIICHCRIAWISLSNRELFSLQKEVTHAAFWKRLPTPPDCFELRAKTLEGCDAEEHYECRSTWIAEPKKSEVEKAIDANIGKSSKELLLSVFTVLKREILEEMRR